MTIMERGVRHGRIPYNPVKAVKKPSGKRKTVVRPPSPEQVAQIRAQVTNGDALMIAVLAYSAVRPEEAQALTSSGIGTRTIVVDKAAEPDGTVKATKTENNRAVRCGRPWPTTSRPTARPQATRPTGADLPARRRRCVDGDRLPQLGASAGSVRAPTTRAWRFSGPTTCATAPRASGCTKARTLSRSPSGRVTASRGGTAPTPTSSKTSTRTTADRPNDMILVARQDNARTTHRGNRSRSQSKPRPSRRSTATKSTA
jgi:hypothetical protein